MKGLKLVNYTKSTANTNQNIWKQQEQPYLVLSPLVIFPKEIPRHGAGNEFTWAAAWLRPMTSLGLSYSAQIPETEVKTKRSKVKQLNSS